MASMITASVASPTPEATRKSFGTAIGNRDEQEPWRSPAGRGHWPSRTSVFVPSHTAARSAVVPLQTWFTRSVLLVDANARTSIGMRFALIESPSRRCRAT